MGCQGCHGYALDWCGASLRAEQQQMLDDGTKCSAGTNVSAPTVTTVPISTAMNSGVCVAACRMMRVRA